MTAQPNAHRSHAWLACVLAIAMTLRALLPQGFMPGSEWFSIKLCPTGLSARAIATLEPQLAHAGHAAHAAHAQHGGGHAHMHGAMEPGSQPGHASEHRALDQCPFGLASLAMALPDLAVGPIEWPGPSATIASFTSRFTDSQREYRLLPRGPPSLA